MHCQNMAVMHTIFALGSKSQNPNKNYGAK